jgi:alpha-beta hydrolase superfamily lysophospholipase
MAFKPSIVTIPGSFASAAGYYELIDIIAQHGYEAFANNLPSISRHAPEEPASLHEDAIFFRNIIRKIADQGKDVIVLSHSYGGIVGTEAVEGVLKAERHAKGLPGGVIRIIYLSAIVLRTGASMRSEHGDIPSEFVKVDRVCAFQKHIVA